MNLRTYKSIRCFVEPIKLTNSSLIVVEKHVTGIKANSRERTGTKVTREQNSIFQWWIAVRSDQMQWKLD